MGAETTNTQQVSVVELDESLEQILDAVKKIHNAFPRTIEGEVDFDGHRRYHEAMIRAANAQEAFWNELKLDIAKKGVWGLLIVVVGLAVLGLGAKFGIGHAAQL